MNYLTIPLLLLTCFLGGSEPLPARDAGVILERLQQEEKPLQNLYRQARNAVVVVRVEVNQTKPPPFSTNGGPEKQITFPVYREQILHSTEEVQTFDIGTGFMVTPDGEVLTNYHIIETQRQITVTTLSGDIYLASVINIDKKGDLALLKIDTRGKVVQFPTLSLGDSDSLEIGESVAVIGHPFMLDWTLAKGIVSGPRRTLFAHPEKLLQLDATIKPGNSGSPVLTEQGTVVGIIQGIIDDIGFAIPINYVKAKLPELRQQSEESRSEKEDAPSP